MPSGIPCVDHNGNRYSSISEMCRHYKISEKKYHKRIKAGYSIKAALTGEGIKQNKKQSMDFNGGIFSSEKEMCYAYGISNSTFRSRIKSGWSLEDALTTTPEILVYGNEHEGKIITMENGLDAKIVKYEDHEHVEIMFEDGEIVHGTIGNFYSGSIAHPKLSRRKWSQYGCMTVRNISMNLYKCICQECKNQNLDICTSEGITINHRNGKYIMTAKEIIAHNKMHDMKHV